MDTPIGDIERLEDSMLSVNGQHLISVKILCLALKYIKI